MNKISWWDFVETEDILIREADGRRLEFKFCHRSNEHLYTVINSKNEIIWQGTCLHNACKKFNKLL
jgi:hypothetical protein